MASIVAQLVGGLVDGAMPSSHAAETDWRPEDFAGAPTQPFRIQFIRSPARREQLLLDEVLTEASDASVAIIAAACASWPPDPGN